METPITISTSDITAICAVAVAIASWVWSILALKAQKKHNKLSCMPFLSIESHLVYGNPIEFEVVNHGAGPARITQYFVSVGDTIWNNPRKSDWIQILTTLGFNKDDHDFRFVTPAVESYLREGAQRPLLLLFRKNEGELLKPEAFSAVKRLAFTINYESIYGEAGGTSSMHGAEQAADDQLPARTEA